MTVTVHSLYVFPIKSCQGIQYPSAELTDTGFQYDRHWMLVDKQGNFLSQRQQPQMAKIGTQLTEQQLIVRYPGMENLEIPLQEDSDGQIQVQIWSDECTASRVSDAASAWFSRALEQDCDLVFLPDNQQRRVDPSYAEPHQIVGFADGFPLLIMTQATAELLSEKLGEPISINRFRPNIVLDGCDAHAEDEWENISINNIDIRVVKPCSRCVIPSIDQQTATKHPSLLKTLAGYRRSNGKVYVGQNALHQANGKISVGDSVTITHK